MLDPFNRGGRQLVLSPYWPGVATVLCGQGSQPRSWLEDNFAVGGNFGELGGQSRCVTGKVATATPEF